MSFRKRKRVIKTPRKIGGCRLYSLSSKAKQVLSTFPKVRLSNFDISRLARKLKIPGFRGVFMRDTLPKKPLNNECAVVNLDQSSGGGTHWVCYKKTGALANYFDSTGNFKPPSELVRYLKNVRMTGNKKRYQSAQTNHCGHLCLLYLMNLIK